MKVITMRASVLSACVALLLPLSASARDNEVSALPDVARGWSIELVASAPRILYPTAVVAASDGTLYLGSDPMDMTGPPTEPIDRVVAIKDGRITTFADGLWSVMGLEWIDGTLYVVHAPFLSAFRDTDGDGRADSRVDLVTGLGPARPGFNGINDHVASGIRLGMDGFLYIAVGDKGLPRAVARDGTAIQLFGGGVIRIRPDGSGLEVVSTGECNPLSVALSATDEVFTYGNDDDSKQWPNSLTHHIVGGHYGYPYEFLAAPRRALPILAGQIGGSGTQGVCYNEDGLPAEYHGNMLFCDWGLQAVLRFEVRKDGGTFALKRRTALVTRGKLNDFRPFALAVAADGAGLWLVDWAYTGWLTPGVQAGRLYRLTFSGPDRARPTPRPIGREAAVRVKALDHPSLAVRLASQRMLAGMGPAAIPSLGDRLRAGGAEAGRLHALWALDAIGGPEARRAIGSVLSDAAPAVRLQAARSAGIRRDQTAMPRLARLLRDSDAAVRREAAIALGKLADARAAPALYAALDDADRFAAWSIRRAIRRLDAWDRAALVSALLDERRSRSALELTDEAWAVPVVEALTEALRRTRSTNDRVGIAANLSGLYRRYPDWSGLWFGTNPLYGRNPEKTRDWSPEGMDGVVRGLAFALSDQASPVRAQAIAGLSQVGRTATPLLLSALVKERDPRNQAALAEMLGRSGDAAAAPILAVLLTAARYPETVRSAALRGLSSFRDPASLRARLSVIYDPNAPESLVAGALPELAGGGYLPPNDLASFLANPAPGIRATALLSLNVKRALPNDVKQAVLDRLDDPGPEVRKAAMLAATAFRLSEAVPRLLARAAEAEASEQATAILALCRLPDPRAVSIYLTAIQDQDPRTRRAGESALLAIRDRVQDQLASDVRLATLSGPAALSLERVLARLEPIRDWRVIGPFPRTTPRIFVGARTIDFARRHVGADGQSIVWQAKRADAATGRVELEDLARGSGAASGFGYDQGASPDLCAFGYTELDSTSEGPALALFGSSGTMVVTVNDVAVFESANPSGRAYAPDTDLARFPLRKGRNRILVVSRQGIGRWAFGVQIARAPAHVRLARPAAATTDALRRFAVRHDGDPRRGEEIFFDPNGIGCARCHSAGGRGTATIGPDLTGLASKYDRAELIRSVLEPSSRIATGYQPVILTTRDGKVHSGVVRGESEDRLELADSEANVTPISKRDISVRRAGSVSIMPEQAVLSLSPVEFSDLMTFLGSLKQAAKRAPDARARQH
jgi:putative heme-binding domain-containing protein